MRYCINGYEWAERTAKLRRATVARRKGEPSVKDRRKKAAAAGLIIALFAMSACGNKAEEAVPVPTETAAPTAAPTEAPTPTPSPSPTAAPTTSPTATPEPTEEPTPSPTSAPPVACGVYTYYSEQGEWKLDLRDNGLFTLTDPDGAPHTGEGWTTETDGTVSCGPTDIYTVSFAFNGGCSRWSISGNTCTPVPRT